MKLKEATEKLYNVFGKYYVEGNIRERSCHCCVSNEEIKELLSKPLRKLEEKDLKHFMFSAISTFGDVQDYKHFLPRILELMQNEECEFIDDFIIFEKLNYSEWETWDLLEIETIESYFLSLWTHLLSDEKTSFRQLNSMLEIISKYVGLNKALTIWDMYCSNQSVLFIVDFIWNSNQFINDEKTDKLYYWFSTSSIKDKIQNLFFTTEDKYLASKLSIVYTIIENYKT